MKCRLFLFLFLSLFLLLIGGCAAQELPTTTPPETITSLPPETDAFTFIVPGETHRKEVLERVPYAANDVLAVNYMHLDYPLPDGSMVLVYFSYPNPAFIVTEVIFKQPDGSRVTIKPPVPTES